MTSNNPKLPKVLPVLTIHSSPIVSEYTGPIFTNFSGLIALRAVIVVRLDCDLMWKPILLVFGPIHNFGFACHSVDNGVSALLDAGKPIN